MAKSYASTKGRKRSNYYINFPYEMTNHPNFIRLSPYAVKLSCDLGSQYKGANNGDLCATWSLMEKRGWRSRGTLYQAIQELLHYGLIIVSRQGGKHQPTLYALTWLKVDECRGKLDINATIYPPGNWNDDQPTWQKTKRKKKNKKRDTQGEYIDTSHVLIGEELTRHASTKQGIDTPHVLTKPNPRFN